MNDNKLPVKTISNLAKLLKDRNLEEKAIVGLEECLDATITMKDAEGKIQKFTDYRTILGAIQIILNYTAGKPVERRELIQRNVTSLEDLRERAKKSPELRAAIVELLDEKTAVRVPKTSTSTANT